MAEYFANRLIVRACPAVRARAALEVLDRWNLRPEVSVAEHLMLHTVYEGTATCGDPAELLHELAGVAPEIAAYAWTTPDRGLSGLVAYRTPGLGIFTTTGDDEGGPLYSRADVERICATASEDERFHAMGLPWITALASDAEPVPVPEPPQLDVEWNRLNGTLEVGRNAIGNSEHDIVGPRFTLQTGADEAAADLDLAKHGLIRAEPWEDVDRRGWIAVVDVYLNVNADGQLQPAEPGLHFQGA